MESLDYCGGDDTSGGDYHLRIDVSHKQSFSGVVRFSSSRIRFGARRRLFSLPPRTYASHHEVRLEILSEDKTEKAYTVLSLLHQGKSKQIDHLLEVSLRSEYSASSCDRVGAHEVHSLRTIPPDERFSLVRGDDSRGVFTLVGALLFEIDEDFQAGRDYTGRARAVRVLRGIPS